MAYKDLRQSKAFRIVVIVVVVILALAMTIPSVATLLAGSRSGSDTASQASSSSASSGLPYDATSKESIDTYFKELVDGAQKKVDADSTNTNALRSLGNNYKAWAQALTNLGSSDSEAVSEATQRWNSAADAYARYLSVSNSDPVALDHAEAVYYAGDHDAAIAEVKAITDRNPSYQSAWQTLGAMYQLTGQQDLAKEAYGTASALSTTSSNTTTGGSQGTTSAR
ncbi:MAG: hypothetical protein SOV74_07855 [Coriobacteriales bacterium]|nr:hypothetical protein [Coriobacteriales bacterium]